ncbi:cobalamin biosynthesis protein CobD [Desulfobacter hydrogenophilus]|uniref:Cobalamin biosynthesis protein CobD n=1 Tax=Desulfobacter hydrogenophilus TaxID=2291 RepID=A0A328FF72_9BACT|nr:adenosylcobinamide-phosphate synthase CbiB [Desulfobacter hydrogenophilus]NDY72717.1 cobalamin biosynthesis protein CobD [Desulfobacter hydrogenophilus]QBH12554.1 cobalamin biosynthesis protein CobD [Desulfobacter hydrogenophilus]RAM03288.1 cobalamin biosynthesis protein CobD [Desulfobacter hydrogenophilus]
MLFDLTWQILAAAFILDLLAGDPKWLPHPIIWMGRAISFFEPEFRKRFENPFKAGLLFALCLIAAAFGLTRAIVFVAGEIHPVAATIVQTVLIFYSFSTQSLYKAAMEVFKPLAKGDLAKARIKVGFIVGRQTKDLDEAGITRAACETVAENFVDGFLSPLCFALVLGAPGAMMYKMINTLDSMVGYKNDTYILFGRAAARMDDVANYIPARLSIAMIAPAAAMISLSRGRRAFFTALTQGRNHKSPNAGFPEAAFAGALGVRFGGPNVYHGKLVDKPYIGGAFNDPIPAHIEKACELMMLSALVSLVLACLFAWSLF